MNIVCGGVYMSDSVIIILGLISVQCCAIVFSIYSMEKAIKKSKEEMLSKIDELNKNILELEFQKNNVS